MCEVMNEKLQSVFGKVDVVENYVQERQVN